MPNLLLLISHGSENLFDLDIFGTSVLWDTEWENGSVLIFIDPAGGGEVPILGCYWAEWDSMAARPGLSAAGCCVCERPVSCSLALQTHWHHQTRCNHPFFWPTPIIPIIPSLCHHSLCGTSQLSPVAPANETEPSALMRLRGVAFPGEKDRQEWEREQEEARRRDHRRIGTVGGRQSHLNKQVGVINSMFACFPTGPGAILLQ